MTNAELPRRRALSWAAAGAVALLVVAAAGVKYFVGPEMLRVRIKDLCRRYWPGEVNIGRVELNYFGPIRLRKVEFLDGSGREHLWLGSVTLIRSGRGIPGATITDIVAEDCRFRVYRTGGRTAWPIRLPGADELFEGHLALKSLRLRRVALELVNDGAAVVTCRPERLDLLPEQGRWVLSMTARAGSALSPPACAAATRPDGCKDPNGSKPDMTKAPPRIEPLVVTASIQTGRDFMAAAEFNAETLGGRIAGQFVLNASEAKPDALPACRGRVFADRISLEGLAGVLQERRVPTRGRLTGHVTFQRKGTAPAGLRGGGSLTLEDFDATRDPLTEGLFALLNGDRPGASVSNIQADFAFEGPVVTVREATLADGLRVMRVEKGGTIDLASRQLDLYLLTLELRGVSGLLNRLPVVSLATVLANKLTRVHVTGTWDDQILCKEPVEDVSAAVLGLLGEALTAGGGLRRPLRSPLEEVMAGLVNLNRRTPATSTAPAGAK